MQEKQIETMLREEIKKLGGLCYKFTSPGNAGVPDRIVMVPGGRLIFVELKTETGKLSKIQSRQIKRIRSNGQRVEVLYGVDGVMSFVEELKEML